MIKDIFIEGLNKGDRIVFRKIFENYYPALLLFAHRILKNNHWAEDIVQESFVALWDHRLDLKSTQGLKSYLYSTVRNKSFNLLKRDKLKDAHASEEKQKEAIIDFENIFIEEESLRLFYKIIDELSEQQREIILKTLEGHNRDEIAEMLGLSVDTIKYHKQKAYTTIREKLGNNFYLLLVVTQLLKF